MFDNAGEVGNGGVKLARLFACERAAIERLEEARLHHQGLGVGVRRGGGSNEGNEGAQDMAFRWKREQKREKHGFAADIQAWKRKHRVVDETTKQSNGTKHV